MQPDDLKEFFDEKLKSLRELVDERDKRYAAESAADKLAVDKALASVKGETASAFAASDKAITKAEAAQKVYDAGHNDLIRKGEDQYKALRSEVLERLAELRDRVNIFISTQQGERGGKLSSREMISWLIALGMAGVAFWKLSQ